MIALTVSLGAGACIFVHYASGILIELQKPQTHGDLMGLAWQAILIWILKKGLGDL